MLLLTQLSIICREQLWRWATAMGRGDVRTSSLTAHPLKPTMTSWNHMTTQRSHVTTATTSYAASGRPLFVVFTDGSTPAHWPCFECSLVSRTRVSLVKWFPMQAADATFITCSTVLSCYSLIGDKPFLWSKPKFDPP